jgi:RHS repeat-associated protein
LTSITDANGNATSYGYDSGRRLTITSFPDNAAERYTYTGDGLLNQKSDRNNLTMTVTYDHFKRLATKTYATLPTITYTYQGQKLTQVVDTSVSPTETHTFAYDSSYRLQSETQAGRGTIARTYNADDTVATAAVQSGPTSTYSYYPDGSLNTIQWSPIAGNFKYSYTPPGQYQAINLPNGQTRNFIYDDQGRLTQITNLASGGTNVATYGYEYDLNYTTGQYTMLGQRVSMTATVPSQGLSNHLSKYEYDSLYQLNKVTYPNVAPLNGEVDSWTYDAIGNRLTNTINGSTTNYTYQKIGANPLNWQRLTSDGANSYTYDSNGSALTRTGYTFGYNPDNRMVSISGAATASYVYDYQGRRSTKTVGSATTYLYDGLNLVREAGASSADYLFGPGIDEPLAMSRAGQVYYYETDALGSVNAVTNSSATVQNTYLYDAWGQVKTQTGSLANPFAHTSREIGEASLNFYRARYYSPGVGRFLQEDPLRFTSPSDYAYVLNRPTLFKDPTGEAVLVCNRKVRGFPWAGNHSYFWDDTTSKPCGQSASSGAGDPMGGNESGPFGPNHDTCNKVPGTDGLEPSIMDCCRKRANSAFIYVPGIYDCHTPIMDCLKYIQRQDDVVIPGGRLGPCPSCWRH